MSAKFVALANLGKGLVQNALTKLVDVLLSTDAGNALTYGSDNGICYVPAGLTLQKSEFFTASSLSSSGGGWKRDSRARWITVILVGGGASGATGPNANSGGVGGEPGGVEWYSGPASDFPATADVVVGAGGAPVYAQQASNDGSNSQFGNMLRALGGRGGFSGAWPGRTYGNTYNGSFDYPRCTPRLGKPSIPGVNTVAPASEPSMLGPGPGGPSGNSQYGIAGSAGGPGSYGRPTSTTAAGTAGSSGTAGGAGANAVAGDPWSFGAGGGGSGSTGAGGAGGLPGGGGGGLANSGNNSVTSGAGGRGEVRVLSYW